MSVLNKSNENAINSNKKNENKKAKTQFQVNKTLKDEN
jgi:hypothetical protein